MVLMVRSHRVQGGVHGGCGALRIMALSARHRPVLPLSPDLCVRGDGGGGRGATLTRTATLPQRHISLNDSHLSGTPRACQPLGHGRFRARVGRVCVQHPAGLLPPKGRGNVVTCC